MVYSALSHLMLVHCKSFFNLFLQKPLEALYPQAKVQGVGILVRVPLASRLLSGKFKANSQFESDDYRNFNRDGKAFNIV
ncbi:hypothetical protein CSV80_11995 [Sporosarcina sp. P12(2017)]|nr:hypothetical protein CSV81_11165 [Sporosarcina sp. P10]PIC60140.1 hypothetical protein CSV80_11995 [Sporosarcina sp. P12(2017)]